MADTQTQTQATQQQRFAGKTALVLGGGGDFGSRFALRFAQEKGNVVVADIDQQKVNQTCELVGKQTSNEQVLGVVVDVTNSESVQAMIDAAHSRFKQIDFAFNNAGYQGLFTPTHTYPEQDFRKVLDINVVGVFNVLSLVSSYMKNNKINGVVVNTASMAGVSAPPNMVAYAASKSAVIGMTKAAAKDLAPFNIRVNSISPAFIGEGFMWKRQTELQAQAGSQYYSEDADKVAKEMIDQIPLRRAGTIDEVIGPVLFLMSTEASYLTGFNIEITGGIN